MISIGQFAIVLFAVAILMAFLRINSKNGWVDAHLLLVIVWLYVGITISLLLWISSFETWILRVGIGFSLLIALVTWNIPLLAPGLAKQLGMRVRNSDQSNARINRAVVTFLYISFGYWLIMYLFDASHSWVDFDNQLWIIPIALVFSMIQLIDRK